MDYASCPHGRGDQWLDFQPCHGKVKDIYKSKELWRGPESIYRKEGVLALSGDKPCGHLFNIANIIKLSLRLGTLVSIQ